MDLYLGLGSNLGDRKANLLRAIGLLDKRLPGRRTALSEFVENPAEGFEGPDFLNAVALWKVEDTCVTEAFALEILGICKGVEQEMGRYSKPEYDSGGRRIYASRVIDVDMLLLGETRMDMPELTLPHPRMFERKFVLQPLASLPGGKDIILKMK